MKRDDLTLDILLHWLKADTVTRNSIFKYAIDVLDMESLQIIDNYVKNIV